MIYTPEKIDYIKAHYNVDMSTADIATALGIQASSLRQWVMRHRALGVGIVAKKAFPGERRVHYCGERERYVVREKQADGSWKFIEYSGEKRPRKAKCKAQSAAQQARALAIGTKRIRKGGVEFEKTAAGWRPVQKPAVPRMPKPAAARLPRQEPQPKAPSRKAAASVKARAPKAKTGRAAYVNDSNPGAIKIKKDEGGHYVRIDARTLVYRKATA